MGDTHMEKWSDQDFDSFTELVMMGVPLPSAAWRVEKAHFLNGVEDE